MNLAPIVKLVRAYDATEWEIFISEWQKGLSGYAAVKRLGGAGDLGRDVIGLASADACQGVWDNYQCKHYEIPLATPKACEDAGKIIFHAFRGEFAPPRMCSFVAPRGPTTELRDLLLNPDKFKAEVIATWDKRVAGRVVAGEKHVLVGALKAYVETYDFTSFCYATIDDILDGHRKTAYWASRFGGTLPPAPDGHTPAAIAPGETVYVGKLLEVYSEQAGVAMTSAADLDAHDQWKDDLQKQRVRFYDAEAFMAHYRDQTEPGTIEDFAEQIHDAIEPAVATETGAFSRLTAALTSAAQTAPASVLAPRAKVRVKQGVCHQLANDDRVSWKT
ncbi:ABC-three component system protein [Sphingomonas sp.]|uniref:ABC-three component system protein n=1 Tax=Sphingomonas sp. TaxID=28214 RepID=UPI002FC71121